MGNEILNNMERVKRNDLRSRIQKDWSVTEFDFQNPTNSDYVFNLFNPNTLSPVPTIPSASPFSVSPTLVQSPVAGSTFPYYIVYNSNNNTIYVTDFTDGTVRVIDCATNSIITTIPTPSGGTFEAAFNPVNNTIYVSASSPNAIYVIDCNTNTIIATLPSTFTGVVNTRGIAYNPINNRMYVCGDGILPSTYFVVAIECVFNTVAATIALGSNQASQIAYCTTNNSMYATMFITSGITVINCASDTISTFIPFSSPSETITYDSNNNTMYVSSVVANKLFVVDCGVNAIATNVTVTSPVFTSFSPVRNTLFITSSSTSNINTLDCTTNILGTPIVVSGVTVGIAYNILDNSVWASEFSLDDIVSVVPNLPPPYFSITGTVNYNQFLNDLKNQPVELRELTLFSQNQTNLNQVMYEEFKDATGEVKISPKFPSLSIYAYQFVKTIRNLSLGKKGMILNVNQSFSNFTVKAHSSLKIVLYYKQLLLAQYFTKIDSINKKMDLIHNEVETVTEKDVERLNNNANVSITPFSFDAFKKIKSNNLK